MTHPGSGNSSWQDWPSTLTPVDAASLERIEAALDSLIAHLRPVDGGVAAYKPSANQSLGELASVRVAFDNVLRSTSLVTRNASSPGHTFTLGATGLWGISYHIGVNNNSVSIKRAHIVQEGTPDIDGLMCGMNLTTSATGVGTFGSGTFVGRLASGTVINPYAYSVTADSVIAANSSIRLAYLGPA